MSFRAAARPILLSRSTFFVVLFAGPLLQAAEPAVATSSYFPPPDHASGWRVPANAVQTRELAGMDAARLELAWEFTQRCTQNGGLLVVRKGYLVFEKYFGSIAVHATDALRFGYCLLRGGQWEGQPLVPADYIALCNKMSPHNPHSPYSLMFEHNSDGHVAGAPRDAYWKSGAGGFALIIVPSLDLVIYKMGGNNGQYDPTLTGLPQPEPNHDRDEWKPIPSTPFQEGSRGGDDGIRRVLEMVSAAVRD